MICAAIATGKSRRLRKMTLESVLAVRLLVREKPKKRFRKSSVMALVSGISCSSLRKRHGSAVEREPKRRPDGKRFAPRTVSDGKTRKEPEIRPGLRKARERRPEVVAGLTVRHAVGAEEVPEEDRAAAVEHPRLGEMKKRAFDSPGGFVDVFQENGVGTPRQTPRRNVRRPGKSREHRKIPAPKRQVFREGSRLTRRPSPPFCVRHLRYERKAPGFVSGSEGGRRARKRPEGVAFDAALRIEVAATGP